MSHVDGNTASGTVSSSVSVVITNYNYARYLPACVESALGQTHPNVEVIVVDDGSTDDSLAVLAGYRGDVKVMAQANGGQGAAFNTGFTHSNGEVIIFLDADDLLDPDAAAVAASLLSTAEVAKAHWPLRAVDADGDDLDHLVPGAGRELPDGDHRERVRRQGPATMRFPPTSGNAWARWYLDRVLPMDTAVFRIGADTLLFEVAPFLGSMARWEEPLGSYRIHGHNRWHGRPFGEIVAHERRFYDENVRVAAGLLSADGVTITTQTRATWLEHGWWPRLERAVATIEATVATTAPKGEPIALIDDGSWGLDRLCERAVLPVPVGPDGLWAGPPASDADAVAALDDLVANGVTTVAVAWISRWWLTEYPSLACRLGPAVTETPEISIHALT